MFNLFDLGAPILEPNVKQAQWRYIRDGLRRNVEQVVNYYRTNPTAVAGDHFLVRLLQSVSVPKSLDIERYYENVSIVAPHLSSMLGMTSAVYKGTLFDGIFYGRGSKEILVCNSNDLDLRYVPTRWMDMTPIRVLSCPITSLGLDIPDGRGFIPSTGSLLERVSVIEIDIPALAVMYREWRRNEWLIGLDRGYEESERTLQMFLRMYVLPNMLFSQLDQVIFNRGYGLLFDLPLENNRNSHPFYMPNYTSKVDVMLMELNQWLENGPRSFQNLLRSYPAVYTDNMYDAMVLPDYPPTRQIIWAMLVARLKVFKFLVGVTNEPSRIKNGTVLNRLFREIRMLRGARIIDQVLPMNYIEDVNTMIEVISEGIYPTN